MPSIHPQPLQEPCMNTPTPRIVLVLGAAGRLGQALAAAFADAGWQVLAQARKPLPPVLAGRVTAVRADAHDTATLVAAARGASVVVNALNPLYTQWHRLALPLARAGVRVAGELGALLLFPGNVYNFGRELPPLLTTGTPEVANTRKAAIRMAIEAELGQAAGTGLDSVVLRAGDFFGGAGPGTWLDIAIAKDLAKGRVTYPGVLDAPHAWAYLPDYAAAFVALAEKRVREPGVFKGHTRLHFEGHGFTGAQLIDELQALAGRPLQVRRMPWGLLRAAGLAVPMLRAVAEMRYLWQRPHRLDGRSLQAALGEEAARRLPHTPLRAALACALEDMQALPAAGLRTSLPA
jgi:nucleoside-diphosphate-sugar epimerase